MMARFSWVFTVLVVLLTLADIAHAQMPVALTVFVDDGSLTVYVPGNQTVSLQEFALQYVEGDQLISIYLEDFPVFAAIDFSQIPTPICFRLERGSASAQLPSECLAIFVLRQSLDDPAAVFWNDSQGTRRTLAIAQGMTILAVCPTGQQRCEAAYIPPTPAPTLSPISAPAPTVTPTLSPPMDAMPAPAQVTANAQWTPVIRTDAFGIEMVLVPPGCFMMGSETDADDEFPVHEQCFDAPFWIDRFEVTNAQFNRLDGVAAHQGTWRDDSYPRASITWIEAGLFCSSKRTARLPTEAEWEYAARGPDGLVYPWGDPFVWDNVVFGVSQPAAVGSRPGGVSWVGALDMSGNAWEWVSSLYQPYPFSVGDGREGTDDMSSPRMMRGSSWGIENRDDLRASIRSSGDPHESYIGVGFRCARAYE